MNTELDLGGSRRWKLNNHIKWGQTGGQLVRWHQLQGGQWTSHWLQSGFTAACPCPFPVLSSVHKVASIRLISCNKQTCLHFTVYKELLRDCPRVQKYLVALTCVGVVGQGHCSHGWVSISSWPVSGWSPCWVMRSHTNHPHAPHCTLHIPNPCSLIIELWITIILLLTRQGRNSSQIKTSQFNISLSVLPGIPPHHTLTHNIALCTGSTDILSIDKTFHDHISDSVMTWHDMTWGNRLEGFLESLFWSFLLVN